MDKEKAINALNELIDEFNKLKDTSYYENTYYYNKMVSEELYDALFSKTKSLLKLILKDDENDSIKTISNLDIHYLSNVERIEKILNDIIEYIEKDYIVLEENKNLSIDNTFDIIFGNFHDVVKKLKNRYKNRNTLDVKDEYDVQDLLFAILQMFFKDIR